VLASCTASRGQIGGAPRDVAAYDSVLLFRATVLHLPHGLHSGRSETAPDRRV